VIKTNHPTHTIYLNGKYFRVDPKVLDVFTPGQFKGQGVFETLLAVGNKALDVTQHLQRLSQGLPGAKVSPSVIQKVVSANGFKMSRVRILAWKEKNCIHTMVMALAYTPPSKAIYKVCLQKTNRPADSSKANIKSLDYKLFAQAYQQARAQGFDEVLLLNRKGHVFEASRANVFVVLDGQLITPPLSSGCLRGIMRGHVIKAASQMGLVCKEQNITVPMLKKAREAFLTNSLLQIKPIKISFTSLPR
jgi:branched-chain amino acid aminotransferase